jgi:hypothetical protein
LFRTRSRSDICIDSININLEFLLEILKVSAQLKNL